MAKKSTTTSPSSAATIHDQKLHRGEGGELHQFAEDGAPVLTTAQGGPVADDQNSLRIGARGPALIDDFHFREKIFHFDHERIPTTTFSSIACFELRMRKVRSWVLRVYKSPTVDSR